MTPSSPNRLHHSAAVVKDLGESYKFYSDFLKLPLVATWCEQMQDGTEFCHAFFQLEDGGAIALFQFADEKDYTAAKRPKELSRFHHLALNATHEYQDSLVSRAKDQGVEAQVIDHGYCTSLYVTDPDQHVVEITVDKPEAVNQANSVRAKARTELDRWLAGDHSNNNHFRQN